MAIEEEYGVVWFRRPPGLTGDAYPLGVFLDGSLWETLASDRKTVRAVRCGVHAIHVDMDGYRSRPFTFSVFPRELVYLKCGVPEKTITRIVKLMGMDEYFIVSEYGERKQFSPTEFAELTKKGS